MIVDGSYASVNHKVTLMSGLYFAYLVSTALRPLLDASYMIKNSLKIESAIVYDNVKYDRNTVATKREKYNVKTIAYGRVCLIWILRVRFFYNLDNSHFFTIMIIR